MFKSNECVGHMVGGAVIGVAVGMLVEKILSPRSAQQPAINGETARLVCCENVRKRDNNLQVPSCRHKNRSHRHHRRSKSASGSKRVEKESSCLSVSTTSQQKSKLSASGSDLRSRSTEKSDTDRKFETLTKPMKTDEKSSEYFLKTSTDYIPFESKVPKNLCRKIEGDLDWASRREAFPTTSTEYIPLKLTNKSKDTEPALFISDNNNRNSDIIPSETAHWNINATCDTEERALNSESYRESIGSVSTEYLMPYGLRNDSEASKSALLSDIARRKLTMTLRECASYSIDGLPDNETANYSINATYDTVDKEINFDAYCKDCTESVEEFQGLDSQEFVTLPTFNETSHLASAEYIENKSK